MPALLKHITLHTKTYYKNKKRLTLIVTTVKKEPEKHMRLNKKHPPTNFLLKPINTLLIVMNQLSLRKKALLSIGLI